MANKNKSLCIPDCKKGKKEENKIRCCICARWFHPACLKLTEEEAEGIWPCFTCRQLPSKVDNLQQSMNQLMEMTKTILGKISDQSPVLNTIESMKHEITGISQGILSKTDLPDNLCQTIDCVKKEIQERNNCQSSS